MRRDLIVHLPSLLGADRSADANGRQSFPRPLSQEREERWIGWEGNVRIIAPARRGCQCVCLFTGPDLGGVSGVESPKVIEDARGGVAQRAA